MRRLFVAATSLSVAATCTLPAAAHEAGALQPVSTEAQLLERSNAFRAEHGLGPLRPAAALQAAARSFALYMAETGRYGHQADGREPAQRTAAQGYAHCAVAENIAYVSSSAGFASGELARRFVDGWIASLPHRRALLSPGATDSGLAVAYAARSNRYYAVQLVARPATLETQFALANRSRETVRYSVDGEAFSVPPRATRQHTQCMPPVVQLQLPGQVQPVTLRPRDGSSLRVEPAPGRGGLQISGG